MMKFNKISYLLVISLFVSQVVAANTAQENDLTKLKNELLQLKSEYQQKMTQLEEKLAELEETSEETQEEIETLAIDISQQGNQKAANTFNPGIGLILNGRWVNYNDRFNFQLPGFFPAEEIGSGEQGFQIGESELNLKANVDDKFYASATLAFADGVEVEEAYIQTLALDNGFSVKAGRFFSDIGYLNNKHSHTDDFANRPLPYEAFLGGKLSDDGVQVTWLAPTALYWQSGIEFYRGESFPAAGAANSGMGTWTAFSHIGGDIGITQSWRAGFSYVESKVDQRRTDDGEIFSGDSYLWIADFIYKWAPQGNRTHQELKLQGEYFYRSETGLLSNIEQQNSALDLQQSGWYIESVYRFARQWRVGLRYSQLDSETVTSPFINTLVDSQSHSPKQTALMLDWTNSEYSRIRLQLDHNNLNGNTENVWILQYIAAFGAHGAHSF